MGETLYSEEAITAHAEGTGATLWRWELSDPRQPAAKMTSPSVYSRDKLAAPLETLAARATCSGAATAWRFRPAAAPICTAIRGRASAA